MGGEGEEGRFENERSAQSKHPKRKPGIYDRKAIGAEVQEVREETGPSPKSKGTVNSATDLTTAVLPLGSISDMLRKNWKLILSTFGRACLWVSAAHLFAPFHRCLDVPPMMYLLSSCSMVFTFSGGNTR